jgi:exo-beta-1,3-glucanase (GH17 family)
MNRTRRNLVAGSVASLATTAFTRGSAPVPNAGVALLQRAMLRRRFVTYQPTAIAAINGELTTANPASIRADLQVLRPWFDALVTYSAANGAERVADIAATLNFRAVIQGVWDIFNTNEVRNAIAAAVRHPTLVVGLGLGNETVFAGRSDWTGVAGALKAVRAVARGLPLSTSEPFAEYLDNPRARLALDQMDFMLVNVHPVFETWFRKGTATNWSEFVCSVSARLERLFTGPVFVKETGVPSGPLALGYSEAMQHDFWRALEVRMKPSKRRAFSYFAAFDSPWRANDETPRSGPRPEEAHWGLFTDTRAPKRVIADFPKL